MVWLILSLVGLGGAALWFAREAAGRQASGASTTYEFPPEVITHSPAFLAAEKKGVSMRKVLCLGDSLTASNYWKGITLAGSTVTGKGWPGQSIAAILKASVPVVKAEAPTDIVLLAGVNSIASQHSAKRVKEDLTKAWQAYKSTGARVWAVKLTPWFGYVFKKAGKPVTESMRAVTREVNQWMQSVAGTADGPDHVIDTSALGDAEYNLQAQYSYDKLHMSKKGYQALAKLVEAALASYQPPVAAVVGGADLDAAIAYAAKYFTERLERNDIPPVSTRVDGHTITFGFYTPFRKQRADELLPSGTKYGAQYVYVRNEVLNPDAEVGQVAGTAQSTPWTCGPAALQAVLAHHGDYVDEDAIAVLAGNVPVLGVRPSGLVKAATELGYHVNALVLNGVDSLASFLAADLPVMVVVDSFTQPGRAGHWVVVTALGGGKVRLMDPHTPGNWRVLSRDDFEARWWHREGGNIVRRFAVIVVPEEMMQ